MKWYEYVCTGRFRQQLKTEGLSIRRRFTLYTVSVICLFLALIFVLLNLFGILNPTNRQIADDLEVRLNAYSDSIEKDVDELAACAVSFSEQLESIIQDYLVKNNLSYDAFQNNSSAINELENILYDTVYLNMQVAPASGAFFILNTDDRNTDTPYYHGIYLKYINLYSEHTVNNEFALYRGSFSTGKAHNIPFHSGWQSNSRTGFFSDCHELFTDNTHYILSPVVEIPETWERARYVYVPIRDYQDDIIGVCGFEVTDLLFQLTHKTEDGKWGSVIYGLLDSNTGIFSGQFSSARYNSVDNTLSIKSHNDFSALIFDSENCIGKTKELMLGNTVFHASAMITEVQYKDFLQEGQQRLILVCVVIALLALLCCIITSKKYVAPILRKFEQLKSREEYGEQLRIREIDDLFAFLAEKDNDYEKKLHALEIARQHAEEEARHTQAAYHKALEQYEFAKHEIDRLSEAHQEELVPEEYEFFLRNLSTLTPAEYRIYDLYLSGKNAKQIVETLSITENTLKYHNKNIYSKLGISSRKQLLRFATLKQHQDNKKETSHK